MSFLINLYALFIGLPTVLRYFGFMLPELVPLNEAGDPYSEAFDFATEPIYTAVKPDDQTAAIAGASVAYSLFNLFK